MSDSNVGFKIKEIRLAQKMTLKELAEKTDLSISFLSMVERGITSATLVSLNKIASAFDVDLSTFFVQNNSAVSNGFCRSYDNRIRSISGHYIYTSLSHFDKKFSLDPIMITLLPSQQREDVPLMTHAGEELCAGRRADLFPQRSGVPALPRRQPSWLWRSTAQLCQPEQQHRKSTLHHYACFFK